MLPDELPPSVTRYNEAMRSFFEGGECGKVNYIDVFNMTADLALNNYNDADKYMTYDAVHWGMEVNLIKAQIILNAFSRFENDLWLQLQVEHVNWRL